MSSGDDWTYVVTDIEVDGPWPGPWIDYYLRRFTTFGLQQGPYEEAVLFDGPGLCLRSYAAALTGRPVADVATSALPSHWLGDVEHTHRAIDDARGYAHLLHYLHREAGAPSVPLDA